MKQEPQDLSNMMQTVIITLSDDTRLAYTGRAQITEGDTRRIRGIAFCPPVPLPDGSVWGELGAPTVKTPDEDTGQ